MTEAAPVAQLARALVMRMQRVAKQHPDMNMSDVCIAIGIAAGTIVGSGVPSGRPDADIALGNMLGFGYGEGVKAIRREKAS